MNNNLELIYWTNNGGVELPLEDWQYKVIAQVLGLSIPEGFWFYRARTQSRGSTLTACGRATLDGVKRHPHPRGCSSFRVAPSGSAEDGERGKAPNLGQGTSPLWGAGAKPLALQSTSYIQPVTGWCNLLYHFC